MTETTLTVQSFCEELITGSGGLEDYKDREVASLHPNPRVEGALWLMRCLANPGVRGDGSDGR